MDEKLPKEREPEPHEGAFEWQPYYYAIVDRLWVIAICLVLAGVAAFLVLRDKEQTYRARAVLFIEQSQSRVLGNVEAVRDERIASIDMVNTVVENIRGYPLALRVAERLKLATDPDFLAAIGKKGDKITAQEAAGKLLGMVTPSFRKATRLIDIFATTTDPALSTRLANAFADEYLRQKLEQRSEATRSAGQFLVDEAERLGQKMRVSEEALQSFRERERAASLDTMLSEAQSKVAEQAAWILANEKQIAQIDIDLSAAKTLNKDPEKLSKLLSISTDARVAQASAIAENAQEQLDLISQRYLKDHPEHSEASRRLDAAIQERNKTILEVLDQLTTARERLVSEQEQLAAARQVSEDRLLSVTAKSVEYNNLTRNLETDRTLYNSVMARLKEVDLTKGLSDMPVVIQEPASGAGPVPIGYERTIAIFLVLGLAAGIGIALLINRIDPSVQTVDQAERWTGLSVVSIVPKIKKTADPRKGVLATVQDRKGLVAEAFRTLRTSIALLGGREQRKVFLFTSAVPSEGKTFCSANFAATLAQQGFRTLLVDADLRKPSVSALFFGENKAPGLSEVLLDRAALKDCVLPTEVANLSVLTAGGRADNPGELFATKQLEDLFTEARGMFDRIVIDSAPVLAVSDTLLIAEHADVNCVIVRAHSTPRKSVVHAIRVLDEIGYTPAGMVLNRMQGRPGYYAYSGRYHASYGAKGVYGSPG